MGIKKAEAGLAARRHFGIKALPVEYPRPISQLDRGAETLVIKALGS